MHTIKFEDLTGEKFIDLDSIIWAKYDIGYLANILVRDSIHSQTFYFENSKKAFTVWQMIKDYGYNTRFKIVYEHSSGTDYLISTRYIESLSTVYKYFDLDIVWPTSKLSLDFNSMTELSAFYMKLHADMI